MVAKLNLLVASLTVSWAFLVVGCNANRPELPRDKTETKKEDTDTDRAEKAEFVKIVQENAADPTGLEIVQWNEKSGGIRVVQFRCKKVGLTSEGDLKLSSAARLQGAPVTLENAKISFVGDEIVGVFLEKTHQFWVPK